ncbi:UNVERIFIED_CONTAM: hypothetical protein ABIC26_003251 [Paenibacillus sp. PvR008]
MRGSVAKRDGIKFGRHEKKSSPEYTQVYEKWKAGDLTGVVAMKELGMSKTTFYRYEAEYETQLLRRIKPML